MIRQARSLVAFVPLLVLLPGPAVAQERPGPVAELAAGALLFADDGVESEGFVGGAVRVYARPRVGVGPEIAYIRGHNHSHVMITGNVTFDLVPSTGQPRRLTPFAVAGAGLFHTRERFPADELFTHTEGAFTAGGGVRAAVGSRVTIGAEARLGWELHVRVNALVGVRLGQ